MPVAYMKTIICLANSRKISGRCVAGKEYQGERFRNWVRPISARPTGELSEDDRRFQNGACAKLLDIVLIPMIEPRPHDYQVENHLINDRFYWSFVRKGTWADVQACLDREQGPLWTNHSSSYNGCCDRVAEGEAAEFRSSLKLVEVSDLLIEVATEGAEFNNAKRRVRGHFSLNGTHYKLSITDPIVERRYLEGPNGNFNVGRAALSISLGELYAGYTYKLIAAVHLPTAGA